jgi:anti-sigma B factor antagonist
MQIEDRKEGKVLIVKIYDRRMDSTIAFEFKERMSEFIAQNNEFIILNISEVDFIDSSGLGAIVSSLKMLGGKGDLVICGIRETVMRMFKLTRMDKVFSIYDTEEEAMAALSR